VVKHRATPSLSEHQLCGFSTSLAVSRWPVAFAAPGAGPRIPAALDTGYFSESAVAGLEREGFDPHIATERQRHHSTPPTVAPESAPPSAPEPKSPPKATAKEKMQAKLKTAEGRAVYARRKAIVEPVFGQIKEARGFRRFLLRGLKKIRGEWRLVCLTHNLLKIWRYGMRNLGGSGCAVLTGEVE
jgi:DDE family transposase